MNSIDFAFPSQLQLCDFADRVNLGLIPSSEEGWLTACRMLRRKTGGVLHIHQNVTSHLPVTTAGPAHDSDTRTVSRRSADREVWQTWAEDTAKRISGLLLDVTGAHWRTNIQHIEHVKSYAPHVHHIVLDLECKPSCSDEKNTGRFCWVPYFFIFLFYCRIFLPCKIQDVTPAWEWTFQEWQKFILHFFCSLDSTPFSTF